MIQNCYLPVIPDVAGKVNIVTDLSTGLPAVGKFGWKDQVPSLFVFSGDAFLNEMGITNPLFPDEICPSGDCSELAFNPRPDLNDGGAGIDAFTDYMTLLGPPPRGPVTGAVQAGEQVFDRIGCGQCHVATLKTGASPVAALDHQVFHPYSDFLLHDIGTGDGIEQGQATGAEMRTAPLWGVRAVTLFLHDGRAATLKEAIMAHEGQALFARDNYLALPAGSREKLLEFLRSL